MTSEKLRSNGRRDRIRGDYAKMTLGKKSLPYGAKIYCYASHRENGFDPEWRFPTFCVPITPSPV